MPVWFVIKTQLVFHQNLIIIFLELIFLKYIFIILIY